MGVQSNADFSRFLVLCGSDRPLSHPYISNFLLSTASISYSIGGQRYVMSSKITASSSAHAWPLDRSRAIGKKRQPTKSSLYQVQGPQPFQRLPFELSSRQLHTSPASSNHVKEILPPRHVAVLVVRRYCRWDVRLMPLGSSGLWKVASAESPRRMRQN